jgi:hypothetical protein
MLIGCPLGIEFRCLFLYTEKMSLLDDRLDLQSGSGARDSVTNRFNGVPLLGPNSMMEWLGWEDNSL